METKDQYSASTLKKLILDTIKNEMLIEPELASDDAYYEAVCRVIRRILTERYKVFNAHANSVATKKVYYMSMDLLDPAPEMYRDRTVGFAGQPDRTARQPVVRGFGLPAVDDPLLEDAEFVEERIPHCREVLGCHRVEVAGCKPPQAAVAKANIAIV